MTGAAGTRSQEEEGDLVSATPWGFAEGVAAVDVMVRGVERMMDAGRIGASAAR